MFGWEQQMIEIAKALMTDAEVIIMDEPTSALTDREIEKLFKVMKELNSNTVFPCLYFSSNGGNL